MAVESFSLQNPCREHDARHVPRLPEKRVVAWKTVVYQSYSKNTTWVFPCCRRNTTGVFHRGQTHFRFVSKISSSTFILHLIRNPPSRRDEAFYLSLQQ